jgi:hypothetical protein
LLSTPIPAIEIQPVASFAGEAEKTISFNIFFCKATPRILRDQILFTHAT